jgi:glutamate-1-semialdehyde 2,1-aminomutase
LAHDSVHFSERPVIDFASSAHQAFKTFNKFFHFMLEQGIYLPPSAFETWFVSHARCPK